MFRARRHLGASSEPTAAFRVDGKPVAFASGAWTGNASIDVFDEKFVHDNIYSGLDVGIDHRRNLARLVMGATGVGLARKSDALAKEIQDLQIQKRKVGEAIQPKIEGMEIAAFCGLSRVADVDAAIARADKSVSRLSAAEAIRTRAAFSTPDLRQLEIVKLEQFLARTVATISADARLAVEARSQILGTGSEAWLAEGLRFGARPACPFCTQPTRGLSIIDQYEAYFGKEYAEHKRTLARAREKLEGLYGPDAQKKAILAIAAQESLRAFWSQHVSGVATATLDVAELDVAWTEAYLEIARLIEAKRQAPLDVIEIGAASRSNLERFSTAIREIGERLVALLRINPEIERMKSETEAESVIAARAEVARLRNTKTRHSATVSKNCDRWLALSDEIQAKTEAKATAKADLETYSESVFEACAKRVNAYLDLFAARFRITGLKGSFEAGRSGSKFSIALDDVTGVPIEAGRRTEAEPCMGTVLSAGDRSSLALAFFLAQFPEESDLAGRCIVFDDPTSSLDEHRRSRTREAICALVERGAQVIVLSHYPVFLADVHAAGPRGDKNALRLEAGAGAMELRPWVIEDDTLESFHRHRRSLLRFRDENVGDPDHMGKTVCAFLEAYLRVLDPDRLPFGDWLGDYVKRANAAASTGAGLLPPKRLQSLKRLAAFAAPYRHDTAKTGIPPSRHPDEVRNYVRHALAWADPDTSWT